MNKTKIFLCFFLVALLLFNFALAEQTGKTVRTIKTSEVEQKKDLPAEPTSRVKITSQETKAPATYKLVTDVLDGFGGEKQNSACDRYVFAGGQSSAIGPGTSTNFNLYAGFVYPVVVKCGDANADGKITVSDVVYLVNYLFKGGPAAKPFEAGEANCDGKITVSDVVYLVNYLFKGGPPPVC